MIGVLCNESERDIVREFFELFKTPWEFFTAGRRYEVVISTLQKAPQVNARLVIIYSSRPTGFDVSKGILVDLAVSDHLIDQNGTRLPVYGKLARFSGQGQPLICNQTNSEIMAMAFSKPDGRILRIGYDLFSEVAFLLSEGQPAENALIPTLELHISLLRYWIIDAGIPVVEIPPVPWGHRFIACLTHDVDFVGIRRHKFDHTFWGFVYRALIGSVVEFLRGRSSLGRLVKNWIAVFSLPLVYLGLLKDFWDQFERYAEIEKDFSSTFFLIPFGDRVGDKLQGQFVSQRATRYDINDVQKQVEMLVKQGYEIGLHGIDAWHSAEKGKQELRQIVKVTGQQEVGVRMHWLCLERRSPAVLEQAGFDYDSTFGYNGAVGYRAGTLQVFRPLSAVEMLELPLHIQDTALFSPQRMALAEKAAWDLCRTFIDVAICQGGVVTVLWHLRSLAPERLWGEFYIRLLEELRDRGAWFGTASQVVQWFRQRRSVMFEESSFDSNRVRLRLKHESRGPEARLFLRVHRPHKVGSVTSFTEQTFLDIPLTGQSSMDISLDWS